MKNSKINFLNFDNKFTDFLIEQSPIEKIKIVRNDDVVIKELKVIPKQLSVFEILEYVDALKVKIIKLLIENQQTFVKEKTKSYKIICNDVKCFDIENIYGCKELKVAPVKEWIVQVG